MKDYKLGSTNMIISLTAAGRPQTEIAGAAGTSVRTRRRRSQKQQLIVALSAAVVQLEKEAFGRLGQLASCLRPVRHRAVHGDRSVVLRTCRLVLDPGLAMVILDKKRTVTGVDNADGKWGRENAQLQRETAEAPVGNEPYLLTTNIRNTKRIAQAFGSLTGEQARYRGLDGPPFDSSRRSRRTLSTAQTRPSRRCLTIGKEARSRS